MTPVRGSSTGSGEVEHRPRVHLRPTDGWTNDPTGPLRWHGRVHLFHQYNPEGGYWDRPHWGHLVSDDLVRWERRPPALSPGEDGPDREGCFSGCTVVDGDDAVIVYTGARGPAGPPQTQTTCLARSRDRDLEVWEKDPANPVLGPPPGRDLLGFRDPFVWRARGRWWQLVGAGTLEGGGEVLLAVSHDLREWTHLGPVLEGRDLQALAPEVWTGSMWECPALLRAPDADLLLLSIHDETTTHHPLAVVGHLGADRFTPTGIQRFDLGPDLYAPCLLHEPDGSAISWGWSWEARSEGSQREARWAGVLSAPRRVRVVDGELRVSPLEVLTELRTGEVDPALVEEPGGRRATGVDHDVLDIEVVLDERVDAVAIHLRCSPDGRERTVLHLDRQQSEVWLDRDRASLAGDAVGGRYGGALTHAPSRIRILLDRSIVEVFVDDRASLTARIYPTLPDSTGLRLVGGASAVAGVQLRAFELSSIWPPGDGSRQPGGRPEHDD